MIDTLSQIASTPLANWLLTYLLYSTVLFLLVRFLFELKKNINPVLKDTLLKFTLVGSLISATLHFVLIQPMAVQTGVVERSPISYDAIPSEASALSQDIVDLPSESEISDPITDQSASVEESFIPAETNEISSSNFTLSLNEQVTDYLPLFILVWLTISILLITRFLWMKRRFIRSIRPLKSISSDDLKASIVKIKGFFRISRKVRLYEAQQLLSPVVLGASTIVLPKKAIQEQSLPHLKNMIAHELAHLKRHDNLWLTLSNILGSLFFFHPIVHWNTRLLRNNTETLCDFMAIQATGDRKGMADCLLTIAHWMTDARESRLVPGMALNKSLLTHRIQQIINSKNMKNSMKQHKITLATVIALVVLSSFVLPGVTVSALPTIEQSGNTRDQRRKRDKAILDELVRDGYLNSYTANSPYVFAYEFVDDGIFVNNKEVNPDHYAKYKRLVEKRIPIEDREPQNTYLLINKMRYRSIGNIKFHGIAVIDEPEEPVREMVREPRSGEEWEERGEEKEETGEEREEAREEAPEPEDAEAVEEVAETLEEPSFIRSSTSNNKATYNGSISWGKSGRERKPSMDELSNQSRIDYQILDLMADEGHIRREYYNRPYQFVYNIEEESITINGTLLERGTQYNRFKTLVDRRIYLDQKKGSNVSDMAGAVYLLSHNAAYKNLAGADVRVHAIAASDVTERRGRRYSAPRDEGRGNHRERPKRNREDDKAREALYRKALNYYDEDLQFEGSAEESRILGEFTRMATQQLNEDWENGLVTREEFRDRANRLVYDHPISLGAAAIEMKILNTMIQDGYMKSLEDPYLFAYNFDKEKLTINNETVAGDAAAPYLKLIRQRASNPSGSVFVLLHDSTYSGVSTIKGGRVRAFLD